MHTDLSLYRKLHHTQIIYGSEVHGDKCCGGKIRNQQEGVDRFHCFLVLCLQEEKQMES